MHRLTTALFCALLLAAPAWAQTGTKKPPAKEGKDTGTSEKTKDSEKTKGGVVPDAIGFRNQGLLDEQGRPIPGADAKMTAAQRRREEEARNQPDLSVANTAPMRGDHLFAPVAYLRPRRLAPGESGVLHVVVTLGGGGSVVLPGSVAEVRLAGGKGPLKFGKPALDPAPTGKQATKFKGQPLYEDSLVFEVPITIGARADARDHPVRGVVRLFLHDGQSGDPQGLFAADVKGSVTVGAPLSKGLVKGTTQSVPGSADARGASSDAPRGSKNAASEPRGTKGADGVEAGAQESNAETRGATAAESDSNGLYWILGLGVVAALGLLLVLRRR